MVSGGITSCTPRPVAPLTLDLQLFAQEKTEPATPKKREEARERGQVPRTAELGTALMLLAGFGTVAWLGGSAGKTITNFTVRYLGGGAFPEADIAAVRALFVDIVLTAAIAVAPLMGIALFVGLASQVAQVGFLVSGEPLKPQFDRINPLSGFKRLFSRRAVVDLGKSLAKIAIVGWIAYGQVKPALELLPSMPLGATQDWIPLIGGIVVRTGLLIGLALLVIAAVDYAFQYSEHERNLRMSKQEVKEELKQTEGDPQLRARIRRRQRELAARRMLHEVPTADVVVTNPVHFAVALKYDQAITDAPFVVAKGAGLLARRIREIAQEHDVPLVEDVWLARTLYEQVEPGQTIPVELFQAVADVLAFVYTLRNRRRRRR